MTDRPAFFALLIACLLAACSSPSAPGLSPDQDTPPGESAKGNADTLLRTDQTAYEAELVTESRARVVVDVPYTLANTTAAPIYLIGCKRPPAPVLQRRVEGEWETAYAPVELGCLSPPWTVEPDAVRHDTLRMEAHLPGQNIAPTFEVDEIEGVYRLVQSIYHDVEGEELLPLRQCVSNSFTLETR